MSRADWLKAFIAAFFFWTGAFVGAGIQANHDQKDVDQIIDSYSQEIDRCYADATVLVNIAEQAQFNYEVCLGMQSK